MFITSGSKDMGIRTFEFVTKFSVRLRQKAAKCFFIIKSFISKATIKIIELERSKLCFHCFN